MQNLIQIFDQSVEADLNHPCIQYKAKGEWRTLTFQELRTKIFKLSFSLHQMGVVKGDRVAILSKTRMEWTLADLVILSLGAVSVPVYESSTPEQVHYVLQDAGCVAVFAENGTQLRKINKVWDQLLNLKQVILFDSEDILLEENKVFSLRECEKLSQEAQGKALYQNSKATLSTEDFASIVYTSGTTGNPKGALLSHGNFLAAIEAGGKVFHFKPNQVSLLFLPLAHILGRITQFYHLSYGFVQAYAESIEKLLDNMADIKPHFMVSVPRIFEKIHERTLTQLASASLLKNKIFKWALNVGKSKQENRTQGILALAFLNLQFKLAQFLVARKLKQKLGGKIEFFISGGAPLAKDVADFFAALDLKVLEGYGLTETTAANAVNRFDKIKTGTVGRAMEGVEVQIAPDSEILIRGKMVFKGYWNQPEATKEVLTEDGWFHTGDVGEIDAEGFLKITDRKKEIIVTAGGKKVAPQNLENLIKAHRLISQVMVYGDRRKYLSALITLNREAIEKFAKDHKIISNNFSELLKNEEILALIQGVIDEKNKSLASFETIKKFILLDNDFTLESGELTPSLKLKRKFITEKYIKELEACYQERV